MLPNDKGIKKVLLNWRYCGNLPLTHLLFLYYVKRKKLTFVFYLHKQ